MSAGAEFVQAAARVAAGRLLHQAANFTAMHAGGAVVEKTMRIPGSPAVLVRFSYPGVLRVFDPATGKVLAESTPGVPMQLSDAFRASSCADGEGV